MTATGPRNREIHLASRPNGAVTLDNFSIAETDVRAADDGEVVVRNLYVSVDPYMRGRMNDAKSYVPPFQVGQVLDGGALGEVIESRTPDLEVGHIVTTISAGVNTSPPMPVTSAASTPPRSPPPHTSAR